MPEGDVDVEVDVTELDATVEVVVALMVVLVAGGELDTVLGVGACGVGAGRAG